MITLEELYIKKEMLIKEKIYLEAKMQVVDEFIIMEQGKVAQENENNIETEEEQTQVFNEGCCGV